MFVVKILSFSHKECYQCKYHTIVGVEYHVWHVATYSFPIYMPMRMNDILTINIVLNNFISLVRQSEY